MEVKVLARRDGNLRINTELPKKELNKAITQATSGGLE